MYVKVCSWSLRVILCASRICTPARVRASDLGRKTYACAIHVICNTILCTWFLYIEEFLILACPTCPTCQRYILVGLRADTLRDTLSCQVSKFGPCIRYDGWTVKLGMWEVNIENVRFFFIVFFNFLSGLCLDACVIFCLCMCNGSCGLQCVAYVFWMDPKYGWVRSMRSWRCFSIHRYVLCIPSAFDAILIELCVFDMCDM